MAIVPGARIGAFQILGSLGAGGMGEVYRARDTRLHREVMRDKGLMTAAAWSPDRRYVLVLRVASGLGLETLIAPVNDPKKIAPLLTGPADEEGAAFSPDGRWIAFDSVRSGRTGAYVVFTC